nr:hypothetical protein [Tanacetum cinerariifolium]
FPESNNEVSSIDDDSFSIYKIDYVEASPPDSELVSSEVMEIVIPEVGGIDDDIPLTIKDDNLRDKLLNVNLLIATIEALNDNPTPSSECKTKSSSTSFNSFLEETSTFHNSLLEFENFYFDLGEISSGSTTTYCDISLSDYEAFYFDDDHIKEISSDSTTTHSDISLSEYDSFIFDLTHEEFVDELAHIISPPDIKSSSTSLNTLLEETNTFDNSLSKFETFCFDVEEISSGSSTISPDLSLPEYEVFYDDHVKEFSSGSPTTHSDSPLYASFMFDLSINPFPPADRSDSYEFTDELIPFISALEYDCFRFTVEPNSRDFTKDVVEDISPIKEPQVLNTLPTHPTLQLNIKFQPSSESLFAYVVWIFLPFLVYSVVPPYLLSLRNEDIIFDPGICKSTFSRSDISHRYETVKKFNTHRSHLNKCPMMLHGQNNPLLDVLLFHFYPP